jgi:hypothetical protein
MRSFRRVTVMTAKMFLPRAFKRSAKALRSGLWVGVSSASIILTDVKETRVGKTHVFLVKTFPTNDTSAWISPRVRLRLPGGKNAVREMNIW